MTMNDLVWAWLFSEAFYYYTNHPVTELYDMVFLKGNSSGGYSALRW